MKIKMTPIYQVLLVLLFGILLATPTRTWACDTTPVLTGTNVQSVGGGNYTVDIQVCVGVNGSSNGFAVQMGCGLNILSVSPTTLTNSGRNATASIAGNTVTYNCTNCNGGNWFAANDGVAGPCLTFTATVNGNPENCPITVTGVNDGCLIIQSSWSSTIPGPCVTDFSQTGQFTHSSTTVAAGNECNLRASTDRTYAINLPCNSTWTFSLCGGASWDTYLYLGNSCCSGNLGSSDDFCGLQSQVSATTGPGVVYLTVEAFSTGTTGTYTLTVTQTGGGCPLDIGDQIELWGQADPDYHGAMINWDVTTEMDVERYYLEKSFDGVTFVPVADFAPVGNSTDGKAHYTYYDDRVKQDYTYHYRVHVHTVNGEAIETDPITVHIGPQKGLQAGAFYPNPATEGTLIDLVSERESEVVAELFDAKGALSKTLNLSVHAGSTTVRLDLNGLGEGIYLVRFTDAQNHRTLRKLAIR